MISFFLPMSEVPTTTHQEKSVRVANGKPQFYEPSNLKAARATFRGRIHRKIPFWAISSGESYAKRDFRRKPWIACRLGETPCSKFLRNC